MNRSHAKVLLQVEADLCLVDADLTEAIRRARMSGLDARESYAARLKQARRVLRKTLFEMSDEITEAVAGLETANEPAVPF